MNPKRWQHFNRSDDDDPVAKAAADAAPRGRLCDHPGCGDTGDYRAPRSRREPGSYWHFCLAHVREYNAGYNYYDGMSDAEIAASQRADLLWNRATHPFGNVAPERAARMAAGMGPGVGAGMGADQHSQLFDDPFEIFDSFINDSPSGPEKRRPVAPEKRLPREVRHALELFDLSAPVSASEVKKTYKRLAKRYHPDLNGGSVVDEERLKAVNDAYQHIKEGVFF